MTILRIGTNEKYADGWATAFGGGKKKKATKKAKKKATKKKAAKKKAKKTVRKTSKKKK